MQDSKNPARFIKDNTDGLWFAPSRLTTSDAVKSIFEHPLAEFSRQAQQWIRDNALSSHESKELLLAKQSLKQARRSNQGTALYLVLCIPQKQISVDLETEITRECPGFRSVICKPDANPNLFQYQFEINRVYLIDRLFKWCFGQAPRLTDLIIQWDGDLYDSRQAIIFKSTKREPSQLLLRKLSTAKFLSSQKLLLSGGDRPEIIHYIDDEWSDTDKTRRNRYIQIYEMFRVKVTQHVATERGQSGLVEFLKSAANHRSRKVIYLETTNRSCQLQRVLAADYPLEFYCIRDISPSRAHQECTKVNDQPEAAEAAAAAEVLDRVNRWTEFLESEQNYHRSCENESDTCGNNDKKLAISMAVVETLLYSDHSNPGDPNVRGETGAYLQYTFARLCGIERKMATNAEPLFALRELSDGNTAAVSVKPVSSMANMASSGERLINELVCFISDHLQTPSNPNSFLKQLFRLARSISVVYRCLHVNDEISAEQKLSRLRLFQCAKHVMELSIRLLGMEPIQQM